MLRMDIAAQIDEFLAEKQRYKAAATYENYRVILQTLFLPWCGEEITDTEQMTDKAMDRFADYLGTRRTAKGKPLSIPSIRTYLRTVRIFLNWCGVAKGRFEMPAQPRRIVSTLSRREIDVLEKVASNERDRLIVRVLADTGIRVGELLGLTLGDLHHSDYERRWMIQVIGKGDKEREVPIPAPVYMRLKAYAKNGGFIFRTVTGNRLDRHRVDKIIQRLAKKAGIGRRVYPHLLRHSWATQQVKNMKITGASLIDLQRTLGHTSLAMISQVYAHTTPPDSYDALMAGLK
jgi:integrase